MHGKKEKAALLSRLRIYFIFWGFLIMVFSTVICVQIRKESGLSSDIKSLNAQLTDATAQQQDLQQRIDSRTSNKAVVGYAHNQLGYVLPNEIIIHVDNYK